MRDDYLERMIRYMVRLRRLKTPGGRMHGHPWSFRLIARYLNGENHLRNEDGTRGRVFPAPIAERWNHETIRRWVQRARQA